MRILVLGGSGFVGRSIAELAVARGDDVTVFNRGNNHPVDGVRVLTGDRLDPHGLAALDGGTWDAIIDTWSADPAAVGAAARALTGRAGHYTYISSRSVYVLDEHATAPFAAAPRTRHWSTPPNPATPATNYAANTPRRRSPDRCCWPAPDSSSAPTRTSAGYRGGCTGCTAAAPPSPPARRTCHCNTSTPATWPRSSSTAPPPPEPARTTWSARPGTPPWVNY
jgi:hypothetical protein